MVDGNEDGAKRAITAALFDLNEHGFTIPVNAFSYYVGKAGPDRVILKPKETNTNLQTEPFCLWFTTS